MKSILTSVLLLTYMVVCANGLFTEVPLAQKIDEANAIVEGKVISQEAFFNADRSLIYTLNTIEVYKQFKGVPHRTIELLTQGGTIGYEMHVMNPSLELELDQVGLFFIEPSSISADRQLFQNNVQFRAVSANQGAILYSPLLEKAQTPFHSYSDIASELYQPIRQRTGRRIAELAVFDAQQYLTPMQFRGGPVPQITSFNPLSTSAGTESQFVINGSGFQSNTNSNAAVFFANANDGGATMIPVPQANILSWTDTQIRIHMPSGAGTGQFVVRNVSNLQTTSQASVEVTYNISNIEFQSSIYIPKLAKQSTTQPEYNFLAGTNTASNGQNFATSAAMTPFLEALDNWYCNAGLNFISSGTTTINAQGNDGVHIAIFDNDQSPNPQGVLGTAFSAYSSCDGIDWYVNDID